MNNSLLVYNTYVYMLAFIIQEQIETQF